MQMWPENCFSCTLLLCFPNWTDSPHRPGWRSFSCVWTATAPCQNRTRPARHCACCRLQTTSCRNGPKWGSSGWCTRAWAPWCWPTTMWTLWVTLRKRCSASSPTCAASTSATQVWDGWWRPFFIFSMSNMVHGVNNILFGPVALCYSGLSKWEDIERLNFLPKLVEIKAKGIPLLQPYTIDERRSLLLAQWVWTYTHIHIKSYFTCLLTSCLILMLFRTCRLPSVTVLNGGAVSHGERESAERFFIRYYQDCPEQELPQRYSDIQYSCIIHTKHTYLLLLDVARLVQTNTDHLGLDIFLPLIPETKIWTFSVSISCV